MHCGKRSTGWTVDHKPQRQTAPVITGPVRVARPPATARLLPFTRATAR
jgi:hypothetical protein